MTPAEKVRENRLRRMAKRRGLHLQKCQRRDPGAIDYGTYRLVDDFNRGKVVSAKLNHEYGWTLDELEESLRRWKP